MSSSNSNSISPQSSAGRMNLINRHTMSRNNPEFVKLFFLVTISLVPKTFRHPCLVPAVFHLTIPNFIQKNVAAPAANCHNANESGERSPFASVSSTCFNYRREQQGTATRGVPMKIPTRTETEFGP
ncbi:hypothetical protein BaRGS_00000594 [Batillaria attramentaria]|uniref:Uncharacterized protein n=1 Tax=Batillaria attramentaria TaxID=370345 RepID=A0ABD0M8V6_9CAEN